jgi:hypothetical protein
MSEDACAHSAAAECAPPRWWQGRRAPARGGQTVPGPRPRAPCVGETHRGGSRTTHARPRPGETPAAAVPHAAPPHAARLPPARWRPLPSRRPEPAGTCSWVPAPPHAPPPPRPLCTPAPNAEVGSRGQARAWRPVRYVRPIGRQGCATLDGRVLCILRRERPQAACMVAPPPIHTHTPRTSAASVDPVHRRTGATADLSSQTRAGVACTSHGPTSPRRRSGCVRTHTRLPSHAGHTAALTPARYKTSGSSSAAAAPASSRASCQRTRPAQCQASTPVCVCARVCPVARVPAPPSSARPHSWHRDPPARSATRA